MSSNHLCVIMCHNLNAECELQGLNTLSRGAQRASQIFGFRCCKVSSQTSSHDKCEPAAPPSLTLHHSMFSI